MRRLFGIVDWHPILPAADSIPIQRRMRIDEGSKARKPGEALSSVPVKRCYFDIKRCRTMTIFQFKDTNGTRSDCPRFIKSLAAMAGKCTSANWLPLITGVHDLLIKLPVKCKLSPAIVVPLPSNIQATNKSNVRFLFIGNLPVTWPGPQSPPLAKRHHSFYWHSR